MSLNRIGAHIAIVFLSRITFGGSRRQKETATTESRSTAVGGAQSVEKFEWRAPNRLTVGTKQVSVPVRQRFFSAHAAPQGLCENLINALKLLTNHQRDGESPIYSIVTGLCERSRKGIMEGLRNFIKVDNHCALNVGQLGEGVRPFQVRRTKFEEGSLKICCTKSLDFSSVVATALFHHENEVLCTPPTSFFLKQLYIVIFF